jgi:hypothetical protein
MSGIDSIQRRARIAEVRDATKAWYRVTFMDWLRAWQAEKARAEAQEADAIVERLIRAHERGTQPFPAGYQPASYAGGGRVEVDTVSADAPRITLTSGWANSSVLTAVVARVGWWLHGRGPR